MVRIRLPPPASLSTGSGQAIRNVTLLAKATGYVQKQHVPDGADVREDDLLYSLNPLDYQAVLDQAKAQAERDAAALEYARANLGRGTELTRSGLNRPGCSGGCLV